MPLWFECHDCEALCADEDGTSILSDDGDDVLVCLNCAPEEED